LREVVDVVSRGLSERTVLSVAGDGAVDQLRAQGFEGVVAGAKPIGDTGSEALDQDVCLGGESLERKLTGG
jgi:hypothetical protein